MGVRKRVLPHFGALPWITYYNANWPSDPAWGVKSQGVFKPISSVETTESRGHAWPVKAKHVGKDVGGNFSTIKIKDVTCDSPGSVQSVRRGGRLYIGQQWAVNPQIAIDFALSNVSWTSDVNLNTKGTKAIAQCIPTNPIVDGATAIGELKADFPRLIGKDLFKTKFKDPSKYGSEYLNVQFGWLPLISDLRKAGKAVIESEKILAQLHRDSGRIVRRRYAFPDDVTTSTTVFNFAQSWINGQGVDPRCYVSQTGAPLTRVTKTTVRTWFSGAFTYYIETGQSDMQRLTRAGSEARKLFGLELTPSTVWNLAPWSWLADWEGNIGDVLHNSARFSTDGLVMRYGYIMQEKTCTVDYTLHPSGSINTGDNKGKELHMTVAANSKVRRVASPFGFGFDMTALTGRQSAILGALALSRGPNRL